MEEGVSTQSSTLNKEEHNLDISEVGDDNEHKEGVSSQSTSTELNNKEEQNVEVSEVDEDDEYEYKISLKDVLILILTGLCLPTWDAVSDNILAGTLIYPQYCFDYSWQEYANKFGYNHSCK